MPALRDLGDPMWQERNGAVAGASEPAPGGHPVSQEASQYVGGTAEWSDQMWPERSGAVAGGGTAEWSDHMWPERSGAVAGGGTAEWSDHMCRLRGR
jgi:hypothetical protein